jgi:hypothetical protein
VLQVLTSLEKRKDDRWKIHDTISAIERGAKVEVTESEGKEE